MPIEHNPHSNLPRSAFQHHDSFGNRRSDGAFPTVRQQVELVAALRKQEADAVRESIKDLDQYHALKKAYGRKGSLPSQQAEKLARIEAGALFLDDPLGINFTDRTIRTFRMIKYLEYQGAVSEDTLQGNLLLIGPGEAVPEVQALAVDIAISDVPAYRTQAERMLTLLDQSPFVPSEISVARMQLQDAVSKRVRPVDATREIALVEPEAALFNTRQALRFPNTRLYPEPVGDFLSRTETKRFGLIASFRTDPHIWSSALQTGRIISEYQRRTITSDVGKMVASFGERSSPQTRLIVTVGTGTEDNDYIGATQRSYLMLALQDNLKRASMPYIYRDDIESFPLHEGDMAVVAARYSPQSFRHFAIWQK